VLLTGETSFFPLLKSVCFPTSLGNISQAVHCFFTMSSSQVIVFITGAFCLLHSNYLSCTDITIGANSGIGFDAAAALSEASSKYHVILGCRSLEKCQAALNELQARNPLGTLSFVVIDIDSKDSISMAAQQIQQKYNRIDVLVNNAGIISRAPDFAGQLKATLTTNAIGSALVAYEFAPLLQKSSDPRLIHVTSGLGSITQRTKPGTVQAPTVAYRMSKAAINMLTACNAAEFGPWGCKVWALCPGYVLTNIFGGPDKQSKVGALSSQTSATFIRQVIEGERDADVGKFIHKDGEYPW
jgi:NAD(P)-dependent dehydrogenase (short-subunit alcohol dehydrogenase family)